MLFSKKGDIIGIPPATIIYFCIAIVAIILFLVVGSNLIKSTQDIKHEVPCKNEEQWLLVKPILEKFDSNALTADSFIYYNNDCVLASFTLGQAFQDYKVKPNFDIKSKPKLCMCLVEDGFCKPYSCFTFDNFESINSEQFTTFNLQDYDFISLKREGKSLVIKTNAIEKPNNKPKVSVTNNELKQSLQTSISEVANNYDLDPALINSIIQIESNWDPNAISACGAAGLTQTIPKTAIRYGLIIPKAPDAPNNNPYAWSFCDLCNAKRDDGSLIAVSSCNSCTPEKCDFVNDERFNPEKSVLATARYLSAIKRILESKDIEPTIENMGATYHSGEGYIIENGIPAGSDAEFYANKLRLVYDAEVSVS